MSKTSTLPWWVFGIAIAGAFLMILGGGLALVNPAMLVNKGVEINTATEVYAGYLVSRNLAIAALLLGALTTRFRSALAILMLLTALIQILDAIIDCAEGRWMVAPGVAVLGALFLLGARRASANTIKNVPA